MYLIQSYLLIPISFIEYLLSVSLCRALARRCPEEVGFLGAHILPVLFTVVSPGPRAGTGTETFNKYVLNDRINSLQSHNHQRSRYYHSHFLGEESEAQRREYSLLPPWDSDWHLGLLPTRHLVVKRNELRAKSLL